MKKYARRILSAILVLAMVFSFIASMAPSADAATFSYNTGKRGATSTSLSSQAKSYYSSSYSYSTLSAKSSSSLKSSLKTLMTNTHTYKTTYANLKTYTKYSDANAGSSSKIVDFYTSATYSGTWDSGKTWNREHVWPQSLGSFTTSNCGADLHHLRPTDPKVNSTRGNSPFGEVSGSYKTATTSSGTVGGYYTSSYFEPLDNVKGDIARILLYCYVRWGESNLTDVIQSTDLLLQWCKQDPVDTWEMSRNDVVQNIQGNRNVFIDYPEYAWLIFGKSVPSMTTPSGNAGGSSSGGGSGSGSSGSGSSGSGSSTTTYTVKASTNNSSYGTVSVSGYTITCSPKSGYEVSTAYLVSGTATATRSGNKIYVTPSSDCSIKVYFAKSSSSSGGSSGSGSGSSTTTYTVTASTNNSSYGTVSVSGYTITCSPKSGYEVSTAYLISGSATATRSGNKIYVTPTSDCSIKVYFAKSSSSSDDGGSSGSGSGSSSGSGSTFTKVTSTSSLTSGNYVLVVKVGTGTYKGSSSYYALKAQAMNTSYVAAASADSYMNGSAPSSISVSDSTIIWKLTGTASSFTLANSSKYLIGSSNYLYYKSGTATKWKATYSSGTWTIKNGTRYLALRPDLALGSNGAPRFRCNSSASSTNYKFYLYKQS